ncbi:MAG: hypothetical protein J7J99_09020, partial [Thermoprotei archaeon]|nr:hypothetical protein [Thermoprotei archaeon]
MDKKVISTLIILTIIILVEELVVVASSSEVIVVDVNGIIDAGTYELIKRGVNEAIKAHAVALILKLNTYGGYMNSMDDIIELLLNIERTMTTVAWVPPGGKAASAGAFIALACDKLFMGSSSVIGACEPKPPDEKVIHYALGRIRSLAERKWGLNDTRVNLVQEFITKNRALSDEEAISLGIADGRAESIIDVINNLNLKGVEIREMSKGLYEEFLSLISD